jgi:hypothetical protein
MDTAADVTIEEHRTLKFINSKSTIFTQTSLGSANRVQQSLAVCTSQMPTIAAAYSLASPMKIIALRLFLSQKTTMGRNSPTLAILK